MATDYSNDSIKLDFTSLHSRIRVSDFSTVDRFGLVTGVGTGLSGVDDSNRDGGGTGLLLLGVSRG
jgi:hypothetical protein